MGTFPICPMSTLIISTLITVGAVLMSAVAAEKNCLNGDIVIAQADTGTLPNGIPLHTVEITNVCATGCSISDIHFKCGMFASAILVNPRRFKRIKVDDCLVNDGKPLAHGITISFKYANTFKYPLSLSAATCST